jgi:hypothetical protein
MHPRLQTLTMLHTQQEPDMLQHAFHQLAAAVLPAHNTVLVTART